MPRSLPIRTHVVPCDIKAHKARKHRMCFRGSVNQPQIGPNSSVWPGIHRWPELEDYG